MKKSLTAFALASFKPTSAPYYVSDLKQDGLRVRVATSGAMTWNVAYRIKGDGPKSVSLGKADPNGRDGLNLADARDRAAAILKAARDGRDLLAGEHLANLEDKSRLTVDELVNRYSREIASPKRKGGALRTAGEIQSRLKRALLTKLESPADSLKRSELSKLLDEVADHFPREAEKRRQSIHAMFVWAVAKGLVPDNPVRGVPGYGTGEPRDRTLSANEIRQLWLWLDAGANEMPPDPISVVRLQLLLGSRAGEISGIEAEEIAEQEGMLVWILPASRSKNKKLRVTPLVGSARDIIEAAIKRRPIGALFRITDESRALTSTDIGQALLNRKTKLPIAHFTTHDLRRTLVSTMDQELDMPLDTIAAVVGHQRGTRATQTLVRHYSRPNLERRVSEALTAWDRYVAAIIAARISEE